MTKLLGSLLVLGASLGGMTLQIRERGRQRRTRLDLLDALRRMGEEIRIARTPLPRLLEQAADCGGEAGDFFRGAARSVREGEEAGDTWRRGIASLTLEEEERRVLQEMSRRFGGDEESLCGAIALACAVLQRHAEEEECRRGMEEKRSVALWGSAGALAVILLI